MPTVTCPNCRDAVEIEPDWFGRRVVCPSCDHRFVAERPGRRDEFDDDEDRPRPRRKRSRYDADDRPRSGGGGKVLAWVVGIFAAVMLLGCGGCVGLLVWIEHAKVSFSGPWADHSDTDAAGAVTATASFPKPPVSGTLDDVANGGTGSMQSYHHLDQGDSMKDATFLVGHVDYPPGTANPLDKGYLPIRDQLAGEFVSNPLTGTPRPRSETKTTANGYPAKEATYADDDGNYVLRVIHVTDRPRTATVRLVVVLAGGNNLSAADRDKFLQSVRIAKGK